MEPCLRAAPDHPRAYLGLPDPKAFSCWGKKKQKERKNAGFQLVFSCKIANTKYLRKRQSQIQLNEEGEILGVQLRVVLLVGKVTLIQIWFDLGHSQATDMHLDLCI